MNIYNHDTPEAITYKTNALEVKNWIEHLEYIEKEIDNLLNLSRRNFSSAFDGHSVLMKLSMKKKDNKVNLKAFRKYSESIDKAVECEDVECDMFYVNQHEKCRKVYVYHLEKYRRAKEEYFSVLFK